MKQFTEKETSHSYSKIRLHLPSETGGKALGLANTFERYVTLSSSTAASAYIKANLMQVHFCNQVHPNEAVILILFEGLQK